MKTSMAIVVCLLGVAGIYWIAQAGDLEPPGPPAPTMKTLNEIEPRIPIETLPGSALSVHAIYQPGSYYLTRNLDVPIDMQGIWVAADDVTIDLNGFAVVSAGGTANSAHGITNHNTSGNNVILRNGTVRGFPNRGIQLQATNVLAENLVVEDNGDTGISVGAGSIVRNVVARNNRYGITAGSPSIVTDCLVYGNERGIRIGSGNTLGSTVRNCVAHDNSEIGIDVLLGANHRIEGNHATNNLWGFYVTSTGNVIVRNTATSNSTNYVIGAGNDAGPIGTAATATSPWANISN